MTFVRIDYDSVEPIDSPEAAGRQFDLDTHRLLMHGGSGNSLWYGHPDPPG